MIARLCRTAAQPTGGHRRLLRLFLAVLSLSVLGDLPDRVTAAELTPTELKLKEVLGPTTPDPVRLWPDRPPQFVENAPPETVDEHARFKSVSVPTISVYRAPQPQQPTMAIVVCPGGGYGGLDWRTHVVYAAEVFNRLGVTVVGLKYRLRPPNGVSNSDIQRIALLDAQRAIRFVRHHAAQWNIDPRQVGIAGYSAGGNLAINAAANFDTGNAAADDPIERQSCRPDFAIGMATWHWRQKESPFRFSRQSPPTFLLHATNDGINGGAPIELPRQIERDLRALEVPVHFASFDEGAHGVGNLIPQRVKNGFPPAQWPQLFLQWWRELQ